MIVPSSLFTYMILDTISGLAIWWKPEWHIIDPILTLGFSMIVLWSTIGVIKSSVAILLEETPTDIDWRKVYDAISAAPDVHNVHVSSILNTRGLYSVTRTGLHDEADLPETIVFNVIHSFFRTSTSGA